MFSPVLCAVPLRLAEVTSPPVKKISALAVPSAILIVICAAPETENLLLCQPPVYEPVGAVSALVSPSRASNCQYVLSYLHMVGIPQMHNLELFSYCLQFQNSKVFVRIGREHALYLI
jgi:hypothetical protein